MRFSVSSIFLEKRRMEHQYSSHKSLSVYLPNIRNCLTLRLPITLVGGLFYFQEYIQLCAFRRSFKSGSQRLDHCTKIIRLAEQTFAQRWNRSVDCSCKAWNFCPNRWSCYCRRGVFWTPPWIRTTVQPQPWAAGSRPTEHRWYMFVVLGSLPNRERRADCRQGPHFREHSPMDILKSEVDDLIGESKGSTNAKTRRQPEDHSVLEWQLN